MNPFHINHIFWTSFWIISLKTIACQYFLGYTIIVTPRTSNLYGKIIISERALKHTIHATVADCYGVASVAGTNTKYTNNKIDVKVMLYLKYGVTIDPVIESVRRAIKYNIENFTGMTVDTVNIDVLGIRN